MWNTVTKFKCPGYGSEVTRRDQWVGVGVMLGGTLVLTLAWMALHIWVGDNPYVDAFSTMPFLVPLLMSLPFTYLKGRPRVSQIVFLGGSLLFLVAIGGLAGFVTTRI